MFAVLLKSQLPKIKDFGFSNPSQSKTLPPHPYPWLSYCLMTYGSYVSLLRGSQYSSNSYDAASWWATDIRLNSKLLEASSNPEPAIVKNKATSEWCRSIHLKSHLSIISCNHWAVSTLPHTITPITTPQHLRADQATPFPWLPKSAGRQQALFQVNLHMPREH